MIYSYKHLYIHNEQNTRRIDCYMQRKNITGYSGKKKAELVQLINTLSIKENISITTEPSIQENTSDLKMIDLFAGTGAFSYAFEKQKKSNAYSQMIWSNGLKEYMTQILVIN